MTVQERRERIILPRGLRRRAEIRKFCCRLLWNIPALVPVFTVMKSIKNFAEWLLGYIYTPAKKHWCIGDSCAVDASSDASKNWLAFRASKFSQTAAKQAGWLLNGEKVRGRLMNYLLLSEDLPEMEAPVSRIFKDGGAWFYEDMSDPDTTAGFLWNADVSEGNAEEGRAHKEINSVNIYAYGEMLTVNAGYTGWYSGYDGYTWNYINDSAISANTVLVNYDYGDLKDPNDENDHQIKSGGGSTQGFTSDFIDYARGNSGAALLNANHDRSFIMTDKGYFVLFDRCKSVSGRHHNGCSQTDVHGLYNIKKQYGIQLENK